MQSLGYSRVKLIGGGGRWVLGEDFFRSFLSDYVPQELLVDELFKDFASMPQDFDFRFFVHDLPKAELIAANHPNSSTPNIPLKRLTGKLFRFLAALLKVDVMLIREAHTKKWVTPIKDSNQFAIDTLSAYPIPDTRCKAFDVDFSICRYLSTPISHQAKWVRNRVSISLP